MASTIEEYRKKMIWIHNKLGGRCVNCGATDNLHIHHVSDKLFTISSGWSFSKSRLNEELKKCELQCEVCHRAIHTRPHGTEARYRHSACRCDLCKRAHTLRMKEYRNKLKQGVRGSNLLASIE